jgi:hypothetical protein
MKKTILTLALVAGLTSFAGSAKAAVIIANLNQFTNGISYIGFGYKNGAITSDYSDGIDGSWEPGFEEGPFFSYPSYGSIGFRNGQSAGDGYYGGSNAPLQFGALIDADVSYITQGGTNIGVNESTGGYWAVRFSDGNGNFNYGYVQVDVTSSGMTFGTAGVETTPNVAITAGAGPSAIPEPSTYTLLGIGAIGTLMVRRKRKTA